MTISPEDLTAALKGEARRLGFDLAGATPAAVPPGIGHFRQWLADGLAGQMRYMADRAAAYEHPRHVLTGVRSLLMLAVSYRTAEPIAPAAGQGAVARYAWGEDYHDILRSRLRQLADFHRRLIPAARVRGVVDTAPLLEREFARLAGLGWVGKNTMLINQRLGSWFFLAALLTSETLAYDAPDGSRPLRNVPAMSRRLPDRGLVRAASTRRAAVHQLSDDRASRADPGGFLPRLGRRIFGCDACQEACPWNRSAATTAEPAFQPGPGRNPVELAELLRLDESEFRRRFAGTAILRAGWEGMRRNAEIAGGE